MSPPLSYGPAYLGMYAALVLGMTCNSFLDIRYGTFGIEVLFWAGVFAYTLKVGWRQKGRADEYGRSRQKIVVLIGGVLSVLVFLPVWGLPRGGIQILAALQAAMNCVTVTRRNLHMGLLVSLIMVLFAAMHRRADWTMLFYLLPYIVAVVFALVAEQVSRRAQELRRDGLGLAAAGGQGVAIAAATATILVLGGLLYAATPQVSITHLYWKYGQPGLAGQVGGVTGQGSAGGGVRPGSGEAGGDGGPSARGSLPSLAQMREAAGRPGMPRWQAAAITALADAAEGLAEALRPIELGLQEMWNTCTDWLKQHLGQLLATLLALLILALLAAAWLLLRETRPAVWLGACLDFLRLGLFGWHAPGGRGARQYYAAMARLFDLHGLGRPPCANAREYLWLAGRRFGHLRGEATEMTAIFERARYGEDPPGPAELSRMRSLYRRMFRLAGAIVPSAPSPGP